METVNEAVERVRKWFDHQIDLILLLNAPVNFHEDQSEQFPHIARECESGNHQLVSRRWTLHIPEKFVRDVAIDAVTHYLEDCLRRDHAPFRRGERRCYNGWYD